VKYSSLQFSQLKLSVRLKQVRFVTRVHAPLCAATFPDLSDYRTICVFRVSLLPLPTSSALTATCITQTNCNPDPQFRPASDLLKYTILLQYLLLVWNTKRVNTIYFLKILTQYIRRDKTGDIFWLIEPSSGLYRREISTFTR